MNQETTKILISRLIAFYLPQYHPIPENDQWWGKGFTEWTNVAKAKPLFKGHYQPHIPADLGFYDLRVPETRQAQADMAKDYGIEGFCYWHYWFAGKRLLERPFIEVLKSGQPDFPFCLAWANESWRGVWHGAPDKILIKQTYPGKDDYTHHFLSILDAFRDPRYLTINNKPLFIIYRPNNVPDLDQFTKIWRELAHKNGLENIFFIGVKFNKTEPMQPWIDGYIAANPLIKLNRKSGNHHSLLHKIKKRVSKVINVSLNNSKRKKPFVYSYQDVFPSGEIVFDIKDNEFPTIIPNWDNTPRSGTNGSVLIDSSPKLFKIQLQQAIKEIAGRGQDNQIIFIKSWNEWAEGNYLEPDQCYGRGYLEAIKEVIND
jgi:hypothetical protein